MSSGLHDDREVELPVVAMRANQGKLDFTLIPLEAQEAEAAVWMFGEKKYGRSNWKKLWGTQTVDVVMASMLRHIAAIRRGEDIDPESGIAHAGHILCNASMPGVGSSQQKGNPMKSIRLVIDVGIPYILMVLATALFKIVKLIGYIYIAVITLRYRGVNI